MSKTAISQYSATPSSNSDVDGIDISEGCPASNLNNAQRSLMSHLKEMDDGTSALTSPSMGQLNVDNLRLDGNTISSTDTNGNVTIDPDGTGDTIIASGNVGIGNASPPEMLSVGDTSDTNVRLRLTSSTSGAGTIQFGDGTGASGYRGYINYTHSDDALAFATSATERMRILASGGLTFNGDTAAANALDDYEEGTWTPVDYHGSVSLTVYEAYYTKIGQRVFFEMGINIASNSSSNVLRFSGLPFTSKSGDDNTGGAFIVGTNSGRQDIFVVNRGLATIACSNSSNSDIAFSNYSNKQLKLHGSYITDS